MKPDVSAPGSGILSTRAYACGYGAGIGVNTNYAYNCGTSMAAPLTAGAMALVREWLVDRRGFTNAPPSAALMKAVITGGAKGRETPDDDQGWGRVDLEETLYPSNRAVRLIDRLPFASGERFTYEIETTNAAPLDVQLAWVDAPGTAGYDQQSARLVNDLDLTVRAVVGDAETAWCGNGGSEPDHLNTLESVRIGFAPAATYRIDVTCKQIVYDHAEGGAAALYIRGAFDPQATEPDLVVLKVMADFPEGVSYGMSPEVGMWSYPRGSRVTLTAGESYGTNAYGTAVAYHACEGFKGSGSVPASGSEATLEVVLDEDSAVDWRVAKVPQSYLLSFGTCNFPESCNPFWDEWYLSYYNFEYTESYWIETNEEVSVSIPMDLPYGNAYSAYAYSYHLIWGWQRSGGPFVMKLGEVGIGPADEKDELQYDGKNRLPRSLDFRMDGPKDIWAYYYDESSMIDEKLPAWWYARFLYGSFANGLIDEAASLKDGDPDGDGFRNEEEHDEETDPVDDASFPFRIYAFSPTNLSFKGSVKGRLIVERCDRLGGEWTPVHVDASPRPSTSNTVDLTSTATNGFYRVRYRAK